MPIPYLLGQLFLDMLVTPVNCILGLNIDMRCLVVGAPPDFLTEVLTLL